MSESDQIFSEFMDDERALGTQLAEFDAKCGWDGAWDYRATEIAELQARIALLEKAREAAVTIDAHRTLATSGEWDELSDALRALQEAK